MALSLRGVKAEPNLVPILDMVFQLITFFLLVTTYKAAEIDFSLKLPVVGSARPVSTGGHVGVLVLNIDKKGNVRHTGPIKDIDDFMKREAISRMLGADDRRRSGGRQGAAYDGGHPGRPRGAVRHGQPGDQGVPGERFS